MVDKLLIEFYFDENTGLIIGVILPILVLQDHT